MIYKTSPALSDTTGWLSFCFKIFKEFQNGERKKTKAIDTFVFCQGKWVLAIIDCPSHHHPLLPRGNQWNSFISACGRLFTPPHFSRPLPFLSLCRRHACHPPVLTLLSCFVPTSRDQRTVADLHTLSCTTSRPPPFQPSALLKVRSSDLEIPCWSMHACTHMCACVCVCERVFTVPLCSSGSQEPGLGLGFGKRVAANDYFPWIIHTLNIFQSIFNSHRLVWENWGRFKD